MNPSDAGTYSTPFDKPIFTIPTANFSSILTVIFFLVFVGWALYTVIVAYHWFRYGHQSWLAVPAIVAHVVISGMCILIMASGIQRMEEFELEPGEGIITSVRVHPYVLAMRLFPFVLMTFVPIILSGLLTAFVPSFHSSVLRFFSGFWLLCVWVGAFTTFTQYYLTVWVITSMRIVDIRQRGFFSREVSSFMLTRVQDVTTDTSGVLGTVFHFGRLSVETAGKDEDFAMNGIAAPEQVRDIIMRQVSMMHQANPADSGV